MSGWTQYATWANAPMSTDEILEHVRPLLRTVGDEHLREAEPIAWAKAVAALGKLADSQRPKILHARVLHNLGAWQAQRLEDFVAAWDEVGSS